MTQDDISTITTISRIGRCIPPASRAVLLMLGGLISSLQAVCALVRLPLPGPGLAPAEVTVSVFTHVGINAPCLGGDICFGAAELSILLILQSHGPRSCCLHGLLVI